MEAISFIIYIAIVIAIANYASKVRKISTFGAFMWIFMLGIIGIIIVFAGYKKPDPVKPGSFEERYPKWTKHVNSLINLHGVDKAMQIVDEGYQNGKVNDKAYAVAYSMFANAK